MPGNEEPSCRRVKHCLALLMVLGLPAVFFGQSTETADSEQEQRLTGKADSARDRQPFVGAIFPEDLPPLFSSAPVASWLSERKIRAYGWADGGFTHASTGSGLLSPGPTPNRFGNEFLLNGAWLVIDRPTAHEGWSWGFRVDFFAGSDAALLRPLNSFGPQGTHLGTDFRQAYLAMHTPGVNQRGIDWTIGRQNAPTGYETLMGPYRPIYSETYFWIHYEVGSTSVLATVHPTSKLDVASGVVFGYNTVFELRGRAPSYIARFLYRPTGRKTTQVIGTVFTGPQPFAATAGHVGSWQTLAELQLRQTWSPRIFQVLHAHYAADANDPATRKNSSTQGAFALTAFKLNPNLYLNTRVEWFNDRYGVRTGVPGTFGEGTLGFNVLLTRWINFRPEIREDFSGTPTYTASRDPGQRRNEFTVAFDLIVKFRAL